MFSCIDRMPRLQCQYASPSFVGKESSARESAQTVRQRAGHKLNSTQWPVGLPATRPNNIYGEGASIGTVPWSQVVPMKLFRDLAVTVLLALLASAAGIVWINPALPAVWPPWIEPWSS